MKPKSRQSTRYGHTAPLLLPPNQHTLGELSFSAQEFARLDEWLAEEGWPAERMDVAMLEGYLVALIVWPVELSPGAWLPLIWGIRGWKVAAKIATLEKYDRFIALVMGMFQELERRLSASPASATFILTKDAPYLSGRYFAGAAWSTGFMTALYESSAGLGTRTAAVRGAVEAIARHASSRSTKSSGLPSVATALNIAVMTIMSERPSRAPIRTVRLNKTMLRASETVGAIQQTAAIVTDVCDRHVVTQLTAEKAIGNSLYSI